SWMVGDKLADVEAAVASGCTPILVRTGNGEQEQHKVDPQLVTVCDDLTAAVGLILAKEG
ncbi:MAG: HAD hydrolase-like protein, partial [Desulfuromonas sp.]|nr:HAD hydrolase-like protein [Desulfuromonas sp.]